MMDDFLLLVCVESHQQGCRVKEGNDVFILQVLGTNTSPASTRFIAHPSQRVALSFEHPEMPRVPHRTNSTNTPPSSIAICTKYEGR